MSSEIGVGGILGGRRRTPMMKFITKPSNLIIHNSLADILGNQARSNMSSRAAATRRLRLASVFAATGLPGVALYGATHFPTGTQSVGVISFTATLVSTPLASLGNINQLVQNTNFSYRDVNAVTRVGAHKEPLVVSSVNRLDGNIDFHRCIADLIYGNLASNAVGPLGIPFPGGDPNLNLSEAQRGGFGLGLDGAQNDYYMGAGLAHRP